MIPIRSLNEAVRNALWMLLRYAPINFRRHILFFKAHRCVLNTKRPKTFSEKVNWRILNDRRQLLSWTCDKVQMKHNVALLDSRVHIPRTLWQGVDLEELRSFSFPDRWILKANHRSQCVHIGRGQPDINELSVITGRWMESFQAFNLGEWAYTVANPSYLLEEWIGDEDMPPNDYKFFVFHGVVRMIQVDEDRFQQHRMSLFTRNWEKLQASKDLWESAKTAERPSNLPEMIRIAESVAHNFDFMRIDLFDTPNGVYFGETTPYPGGGLSPFSPKSFDAELGAHWCLPILEAAGDTHSIGATQAIRRDGMVG